MKQVFQGKFMREDASFCSKLFFSYAWPLLETSMESKICFEQYGDLPEGLKCKHEVSKIESSIQHYIRKNPQDRFAFMKGLAAANKDKIFYNLLVKIVRIVTLDWTTPFLITETTNWI